MADTIYICDAGATDKLNGWLGRSASLASTGKVRLYSNSVALSKATALGALTETSFPGYAAISISGASWAAPTVSSHLASSSPTSPFTFTCSGGGSPQTVYGAYITDASNTVLLACWTFASGPYTLTNSGDNVQTSPVMTEQSLN